MLSKLLLILAVAVVMVSSQWSATIDPSSVSLPLRKTWCSYQQNSCPLICLQVNGSSGASVNTCDANSLDYSCICSNGISPNASEYSETMAYFICTEAGNQCVTKCAQTDSSCQASCRDDHPCGAQDPVRINATTTTTTSAASSATASSTSNPLGTDVATGGAVRMSLELGQVYGLCAFVGAFVAGFAVLL
ncbi:hypothetical protein N7448_003918 [Penicillium atrosanguineum]|uniref:DUF7707 domain-containing protein n=1 Tax=Penicillium atrosanguineum TaxID=1132637 RepID=A0A9W9PYG7_9EURO|nr:hypothetical protein N7526_009723 [Penicillium atrosanguineum]KAJ5140510.1 hypothetical protein N7448_003918 [Penicillium atrosanguineum]KAJ5315943.1 hypothetical protein N7476_006250 [Penicillium atrosanguineum]